MTFSSLLLILGSAVIHVVAHVALKRTHNRAAFVWWMLLWGGLLFSPVLIFGWHPVPPVAWGVMLASAVFEALYFAAIAQAYHTGDLSIVYPLARGTAPVLLLIWSASFLRERPTVAGVAGIVLIAAGLYVVNLPRPGAWREPLQALGQAGPRWALFAGLCISLYTVIDRVGIGLFKPSPASWPLLYTYLALWLTWGLLTPWTLQAVGWGQLKEELRASRFNSVIAGFTTLAAYAVVLYAMRAGTPASYAGAVREISVVLGVAAGVFLLKERGTAMRLAGSALVVGGVAVIAFFGRSV
jgi:drug/metabolite transporter (DMT)-like permease